MAISAIQTRPGTLTRSPGRPPSTIEPTACTACGRSTSDHETRETKRCRGALLRGMRPLVRTATAA